MEENEEPDVVVVSSKGQVVIPQAIREKLNIGPRTKLLVYGYGEGLIMKKFEVPDLDEDLRELYRKIDARNARYGELSEAEIGEIVRKHRKHKAQ